MSSETDRRLLYEKLVVYQVERLKGTYSDLREDPRYRLLSRFFFEDVYSTSDKSERDAQFRSLYELVRRRLGESITRGVGDLVALNDLSNALDLRMVGALQTMETGARLTDAEYQEAFQRCDNHDDRVRQIEMLLSCIGHFQALSEHLYIGIALKAVKVAAAAFGGYTVIAFLDRGYHAYRSVTREETTIFMEALRSREMELLDRIYGRLPGKGAGAAPRGR